MATEKTNPIRVGIIGLGRAGWKGQCPEIDMFPGKFKVVAVCDIEKDRRDAVQARYSCRGYRQMRDILADSDVELVTIATRTADHFAHALAALDAGKYVLLEKPMCMDYAEALKLRAAAVKTGVSRLFIRHNRRFEPVFQRVKEIIGSGILGEIYSIKLFRGCFSRRDDWQTVRRCGGGQLLNWGPHLIDQALQILGPQTKLYLSELKRVAAAGDAEDYVHLVLRNPANASVDLEISGGRIIRPPEYIVSGTQGGLIARGDTITLCRLDPKVKLPRRRASVRTPPCTSYGTPEDLKWIEEVIKVEATEQEGSASIWGYLYDTIRAGKPFPITIDEAVEVMRMISAARLPS